MRTSSFDPSIEELRRQVPIKTCRFCLTLLYNGLWGVSCLCHCPRLGLLTGIITSRVASRGDVAKQHIEEAAGPSRKGDISCLELDLERYDSCTSFMAKLKSSLPGPADLDVAIVNGGIYSSGKLEKSAEGW
ncbi:hypothetical protein F4781DRAFT_312079 [Annulohypoxylon bovei var. microspora]|nr:hypothetical protein F4781DRAFT_312079 [Annulohypoxylon bovei var. microspora]